MKERRKFLRAIYPCQLLVSTAEGKEEFKAHTENISSGGARVIFQKKFDINTPVDLDLVIGQKRIKTKGRVVWVLDVQTPGTDKPTLFDTGIEFIEIDEEARKRINKYVFSLR